VNRRGTIEDVPNEHPSERYLPALDLRGYRASFLPRDLSSAIALVFLAVPQGVAYAIIAGLPPVMGLYAASIPVIVGSLLRSSRTVVTGPTNAVSLLVGSIVAGAASRIGASPMEIGITLAFVVGLIQVAAGLLRLDVSVDYISNPVLLGYMSGAAVLIAVGQLPNATGTKSAAGNLAERVAAWVTGLGDSDPIAIAFTIGTLAVVLALRRLDRRIPAAMVAMVAATAASWLFALRAQGLRVVADVAPVPAGFPPLTMPSLDAMSALFSGAVACTVLSLVEGSSVARAIASRREEHLDMAAEFTGQGLANLAAAFSGAYPVGGSLSRSVLNEHSGAATRLAAALSGALMLLVLLAFGPLVDETPLAGLAGLLFVIAADLIDPTRIRMTILGTTSDRIAFFSTLVGTWTLALDHAIYLGVAISLALFLRRARLLTMRELAISEDGRISEMEPQLGVEARACSAIRVLNLSGPVFFAVAGELDAALERFVRDPELRVLIVRMRQADLLDVTTASVLEAAAQKLAANGRTLYLLGLRRSAIEFLERTGLTARIGEDNVFPIEPGWFSAMESALKRALEQVGEHGCGKQCPFREYLVLQRRARRRRAVQDDWSI
jgi:sulfate permease, SulP family